MSGRRGSNSRPLAWKANALSTELLPQIDWCHYNTNLEIYKSVRRTSIILNIFKIPSKKK